MPAPEIKGWCPGALRPMASNDGLLFRAKTIGSRLRATQAREIAAISNECGNGAIDLSQRAQLQLRGLREATLDKALRRLSQISMLAPDAAAESVMNILASPLAGFGDAPFDANAVAANIAKAIEGDTMLRALPGKFLFLADDGTAFGLADIDADIRIEALGSGAAIVLSGARDRAVIVEAHSMVEAALNLARAFVTLRQGRAFELRRMPLLVGALGASAVFREAGLTASPYRSPHSATRTHEVFGAHSHNAIHFAGAGAPFGRWRAADLAALAALAEREGLGEMRLTPWRAILVPTKTREAATRVAEAASQLGLIASGDDLRLAIAACPGAPECPQALGATRAHLALLAPLAKRVAETSDIGLHMSGCAKGCARPQASPVTVIALGGAFDLIDHGRACDTPSATGLSFEALEAELAARGARKGETSCPA